jgi:hypothetical protein
VDESSQSLPSRKPQNKFVVAGLTDHITSWKGVYSSAQLFGGTCEFVLSSSGHIQSLINPPTNLKAKFFINRDVTRAPERMQRLATSLLCAMVAMLLASAAFQPAYPWLHWVRAFAEAGTVGAFADLFAVVALFRHPLGLPIPQHSDYSDQ